MADKVQTRKSPLGFLEYLIPQALKNSYGIPTGAAAVTQGNKIFYDDSDANTESVVGHERMHVGQNSLAPEAFNTNVNKNILRSLLGIAPAADERAMESYKMTSGGWGGDEMKWQKIAKELPAYLFSQPGWRNPKMQLGFNNYMDELYKSTYGQTYPLEAQMSTTPTMEEYVLDKIKYSGLPAPRPNPNMKKVPLY